MTFDGNFYNLNICDFDRVLLFVFSKYFNTMSEKDIHRLEGSENIKGGLVLTKKKTDTFKVPQVSKLGLDKLAAAKRLQKELCSRLSFNDRDKDDEDVDDSSNQNDSKIQSKSSKNYRSTIIETPTHTGGLSEKAREKYLYFI